MINAKGSRVQISGSMGDILAELELAIRTIHGALSDKAGDKTARFLIVTAANRAYMDEKTLRTSSVSDIFE